MSPSNPHKYSLTFWLLLTFTCVIGAELATAQVQPSNAETVLYSFTGTPNGSSPSFDLIQDGAGNFYGVTSWGGAGGWGAVFTLSEQGGTWVEKVLHSFLHEGYYNPAGGLAMDTAGNLYGVANWACCRAGPSIVYQLSPNGLFDWKINVLKAFNFDNVNLTGSLAMDAAGNIFGVNQRGGSANCRYGCGFVYELSPPTGNKKKWGYTIIYKFLGPAGNDTARPNGDLIFDAAGNLYGTGQGDTQEEGSVFQLSPGANGWKETILYTFAGGHDAGRPTGGLVFDPAGNLYGAASAGGEMNWGAIFELSPGASNWTEQVLYSFTGQNDGAVPLAPLTLREGTLYGTTEFGGDQPGWDGSGVVFKLSPTRRKWKETVLHTFTDTPDGSRPQGGVVFDSAGQMYGTTALGGTLSQGTAYQISP